MQNKGIFGIIIIMKDEKNKRKVKNQKNIDELVHINKIENIENENYKIFEDEQFEKIKNPIKEIMNQETIKYIFLIAVIIMLLVFFFIHINTFIDLIKRIFSILTPIILGWVMTFVLAPLYNIVENAINKKANKDIAKFSKVIATVTCVLVVLLFTIGVIFLFVPQLYNSITSFSSRAGGYIVNARELVSDFEESSHNDVVKSILSEINSYLAGLRDNTSKINYSAIMSSLYTGFAVSVSAVMNFFIGIIAMVYTLNMKEEMTSELKRILFALARKDIAQKILVEVRYAKQVFEGFFVGKFLDSLIIGIICYVCCMIMQLPYTPLIAVIVGITNIIPVFGPFVGAIPSFILIILEEPFSVKPYMFLVFILILQQVDGNIIGPKILGDKTGVGSFWVLFSIILFGGLFGFVGMLIAVPLWAVITRLFDQLVTAKLRKKHYPTNKEEYEFVKKHKGFLKEINS